MTFEILSMTYVPKHTRRIVRRETGPNKAIFSFSLPLGIRIGSVDREILSSSEEKRTVRRGGRPSHHLASRIASRDLKASSNQQQHIMEIWHQLRSLLLKIRKLHRLQVMEEAVQNLQPGTSATLSTTDPFLCSVPFFQVGVGIPGTHRTLTEDFPRSFSYLIIGMRTTENNW